MRITKGMTRVVILTDRYAIKIARFGILRMAVKSAWAAFDRRWRIKKIADAKETTGSSGVRSLFGYALWMLSRGIRANRQEYRMFREHPELPIAPVRGLYLGGLAIVMSRGEAVDEAASEPLRKQYRNCADLDHAYHVCRFADGLRYIDYGNPEVPPAFGL